MKKLVLIRHAKATHETGYVDFERPLTQRGMHDAAIMAGRLKEQGLVPKMLVSSPALRTLSTANVFSQHLNLPAAAEEKSIYEASEGDLLNVVTSLPDEVDFIGLVGHNPGIGQLLYYLSGAGHDMPTCATAVIEFSLERWGDITANSGKLTYFDSPKENL